MKDHAFTSGLGAGLVVGVWINIIVFGIFSLADKAPRAHSNENVLAEMRGVMLDRCLAREETARQKLFDQRLDNIQLGVAHE